MVIPNLSMVKIAQTLTTEYYSPKQEIDQKFEEFKEQVDWILDKLQREREEHARK